PAQDPATLDALRADLTQAKIVRVTSASGTQMLRDVRLDSLGIASARWRAGAGARPALFTSQDAMPPPAPPPTSWSDISRIETGSTNVPIAAQALRTADVSPGGPPGSLRSAPGRARRGLGLRAQRLQRAHLPRFHSLARQGVEPVVALRAPPPREVAAHAVLL